ncbi:unnamed protein product, partial [Porites lobata]
MRPNSDDWFILADSTFNREQWYENFRVTRDTFTIILNEIEHDIAKQDTRCAKLDVVIGWPGSVHDARILSNSTIYDKGNDNNLFPDIRESIGGQVVSIVILGDPAYPLLPWLLKAYPENVNTPQSQRVFNYRLSRARMTVENTFGRWKGRFRRFSKR